MPLPAEGECTRGLWGSHMKQHDYIETVFSLLETRKVFETDGLLVSENYQTGRQAAICTENQRQLYLCFFFLARKTVDSVLLCDEGCPLFSWKPNNTFGDKSEKIWTFLLCLEIWSELIYEQTLIYHDVKKAKSSVACLLSARCFHLWHLIFSPYPLWARLNRNHPADDETKAGEN